MGSPSEIEVLLEHWYEPIREGVFEGLVPFQGSRAAAEKFLAWLKARKDYSESSLYTYLRELRRFSAFMSSRGRDFTGLSYDDCLEYLSKAGRGKAAATLKLLLRFLYEATGDERYRQLYERVKTPGRKARLPEVLSTEQVRRLIEECGREGLDLKVLVALLYETGARVGEVLKLKGKDVAFDEHGARIIIRRSKSQPRVLRVALYASLLQQYLELTKPGPEDLIFPKDYTTYRDRLQRAWERAGLPKTRSRFHILRHTRATELLKSRVFTEKEMMLWFGWNSRAMIDVYSHITMEDVERAYLASIKGESVPTAQPSKPVECPKCRSLNPPEARFCLRCGGLLKPEAVKEVVTTELQLNELLKEIEELKKLVRKGG